VILYFHPSNDSLKLNALVRIVRKDKNYTILKFDSIIGYQYRGNFDSKDILKIVSSFDSVDFADLFYRNVIKKINMDSLENTQVYYDNKRILNTFKE